MDELTGVGCVFVLALALLLAGSGCAGRDELGDDQGDDAAELEQPQAVDCRPVRFDSCSNPWNDRACFRVPPECAAPALLDTNRE